MQENKGRRDEDISYGPSQNSEILSLLADPSLSDSTYGFCLAVTSKFDFETRLEALLKRSLWHHVHPELKEVELQLMGEAFIAKIQDYITCTDIEKLATDTPDLSPLSKKISSIVSRKNLYAL